MKTTFIVLLFSLILFLNEVIYSQSCSDCTCGTAGTGTQEPDSLIGGRFKPVRTDLGGAPSNLDNFPVLVVFVQFSDEPYSNSTDPGAWNSGQAPNYIDSLVSTERLSSTNWWNDYNGFAISDYWHEFSRGKLHITGQAVSIILPHPITWYDTLTRGIAKVNKDVYDILIQELQAEWLDFDKWKFDSTGVFQWSQDRLVDMMYVVFRQWRSFLFEGNYWGYAALGNCIGSTNYTYTVYTSSQDTVKIHSANVADPLGSGIRVHADYGNFSKQRFLDLATHEHAHYFSVGHIIITAKCLLE